MVGGYMSKAVIASALICLASVNSQKVNLRSFIVDIPKTDEDQMFLDWIAEWGKSYVSTSQFMFRREIFKRNLQLVQ